MPRRGFAGLLPDSSLIISAAARSKTLDHPSPGHPSASFSSVRFSFASHGKEANPMHRKQQFFRILCALGRVTTVTLVVGMFVTPAFAQNPVPPTAQPIVSTPSLPCPGPPTPTKAVIDWAQFLFDPCHTGFNPYEFVLSPATVVNLGLHWKYTTGNYVFSPPAVTNRVVYVGSADHNVYALNARTGALLWKYTTGYQVFSSPAVANGVVYVGSEDNNLYALNANTGAFLWKYPTGNWVYSSPTVANGVVYVGSSDFNLYALNASTGALLWKYTTGGAVESSPVVANGVVYVGSKDNNVYAFGL